MRFAVDTYDREVERYGGSEGTRLAEALFAVDSRAVAEMLSVLLTRVPQLDRILIAALSVDDLLESVGFSQEARVNWYKRHVPRTNDSGLEYRLQKSILRALLGDRAWLPHQPGGAILANALARRREGLIVIGKRLAELEFCGELTRSLSVLCQSYVHLHLNRFLGADGLAEGRVLGLSRRTCEGLYRAPHGASHE
jgi:thiopeptide-type bacteriocin biosynthesis protein